MKFSKKVLQDSLALLLIAGSRDLSQWEDLRKKSSDEEKKHKEEGKERIQSNAEDKQKLQTALKDCIHPIDTEAHQSNTLVNIQTREEASEDVNVNKSICNNVNNPILESIN